MSVDFLSFTVREVETEDDLAKACKLRADCYGRHAPALREHMAEPDLFDASPWTTVFLCEDKASGAAVGTMRVVDNARGAKLEIEEFLEVPEHIIHDTRGEMTRLVVAPGSDPLVKAALWKAGYLRCASSRVQWLIIGARKPGLISSTSISERRIFTAISAWCLSAMAGCCPTGSSSSTSRMRRRTGPSKGTASCGSWSETDHPDICFSSMHGARSSSAPRLEPCSFRLDPRFRLQRSGMPGPRWAARTLASPSSVNGLLKKPSIPAASQGRDIVAAGVRR
jgi:hypothetical protein